MHFVQQGNTLTALIPNPRKLQPEKADLSSLTILFKSNLERLLNATQNRSQGQKYKTQFNTVVSVLRPFSLYLHWDKDQHHEGVYYLPTKFEGWQRLVLQFAAWYISHSNCKSSLDTRCDTWRRKVRPWLDFLQEEGILPIGIMIPDLRLPKEQNNYGSPQILATSGLRSPSQVLTRTLRICATAPVTAITKRASPCSATGLLPIWFCYTSRS
ncbi:hypothetical protein [Photobacterium ganghwense]|uniref:hypothetical protein n=1 Tax=Photobacterium ganghwense TaxID=320778 RepID=UPI001C2D84F2|nr:hypothetical protein [Photobacterium ganghwense]MBV1839081.1 hypothetical protein [Photobacterium ganghwense]